MRTTPIIYFAGVNTSPYCEAFQGLPVLETFAEIRDVTGPYRPLFNPIALDSGAYTARTQGQVIDIDAFIAYCLPRLTFYEFIASLDVIGGTIEENHRNWQKIKDAGVPAMPTWHTGEPLSVLADYCKAAPYVGIGITRPNNRMPAVRVVREFLDQAFSVVPTGHKIHGWGLTNYIDYPFHSVDSTTWLREYLDLRSYKGQGNTVLRCLTNRELLDLVKKKYERLPIRNLADGVVEEEHEEAAA